MPLTSGGPSSQLIIHDIVGREYLQSAVRLNSTARQLGILFGPAVGGVLLNNALNKVDNFTVQRTFWTASAIMIVAALIAVYFAKMNQNQAIT